MGTKNIDQSFAHLHVHTEYSMLDGAARLGELLGAAAELNMPAIAITDHGNMFGAYDFYKQAKGVGIKPIIGIEAYLTPGTSRFDRTRVKWADGGDDDVSGGGAYTHMTMLAQTTAGMHNLFRLSSLASLEGYYYKPRMDREILETYARDIIATTGCPSGEVQTKIRIGDYKGAAQVASDFRDIFGAGSYYVELMDHGLNLERRVREDLLRLAKDLDLPLLATNDLHYTHASDAEAHDALLCVQSNRLLSDPTRFKFDGDGYYLKTAEQMRDIWSELPEACDNTLRLAERCEVTFNENQSLMPLFDVPEGESQESWFVKEVERGLHQRYPRGIPDDRRTQADYEVGVILQTGFPSYFLVTADFIRYAKDNGIRVGPGRGSAAGSLVAYVLGITDLDPITHGLLFERFLNPERVSMPDIDIDFDERRRADVIRYVTEKYGEERVAQIVTYGTIKAKAALKDAARVLGYPYAMGEKLTKAMPLPVMGKDMGLSAVFDPQDKRYSEAGELRALVDTDPDARRVMEVARGIENLKRQSGVHAAGVIMSSEPLIDHIPIMRREQDGAIITQFDYPTCEKLGLLKMDFLGLRNLTVLDDALRNIEANRGETIVLEDLTLDDPAAYALLASGETLGVFQLDGGPMRSLLRSMQPDTFEDISAVLALYRPGPMGANAHYDYADRKTGRKPVEAIHPELKEPLEELLGETYGVIVYQEQVMAIAQQLAGYSLGQADLLRRAMGKKKKEILDEEYVPFSDGMRANGFSEAAIKTLWDILVPFSDYAFNKAHTAGYGLVSYWTAFLKANYPAEYMAALLTSVGDRKDTSALYLAECRRMGIKVLPPDVNESVADYAAVGSDIRYGLAAIRNVGENVVAGIVAARRAKGLFTDFSDFLRKVDQQVCNKRTIESLIKGGTFDSLGHSRRGLVTIHEAAVDAVIHTKKAEAIGQFSMFGEVDDDDPGIDAFALTVPAGEWDKSTLLAFEREMLGLYVSDHPLLGVEHLLRSQTDCSIAALAEGRDDGAIVTVGGLVAGLQRKITKKGDSWAVVTLEDLEGSIEVMFFPQSYQQHSASLAEDTVLLVRGRLDKREDTPRLTAMDIQVPDLTSAIDRGPLRLTIPATRCTEPVVARLRDILRAHPGTTEVLLELQGTVRKTTLKVDDGLRVGVTSALMGDLKALLGTGCLVG